MKVSELLVQSSYESTAHLDSGRALRDCQKKVPLRDGQWQGIEPVATSKSCRNNQGADMEIRTGEHDLEVE